MRESEAIIRLNVFTVRAAKAISKAVSQTLVNLTPQPIVQNVYTDLQPYVNMTSDGEFCLTLANTTDGVNDAVKFHLNLNVVKASVQMFVYFLEGSEEAIFDSCEDQKEELIYEDNSMLLRKDLESILRWWDGCATEEDKKLVGRRLNPFESLQINECLTAIRNASTIGNNNMFRRKDIADKIRLANVKISEMQDRLEDIQLVDISINNDDDDDSCDIERLLMDIWQ